MAETSHSKRCSVWEEYDKHSSIYFSYTVIASAFLSDFYSDTIFYILTKVSDISFGSIDGINIHQHSDLFSRIRFDILSGILYAFLFGTLSGIFLHSIWHLF